MSVLESLHLNKRISKAEYEGELLRHQLQLRELAWQLYLRKRSLIVVFEGRDAAGKGGCIRRLTERLDPRGYEVFPIAAPEGEDRTHHYLWRFWRRLQPPDEKQIVIFDRSWYGRVLVERVEGFATEEAWKRAYREINDFESQLADAGAVVVKLWLQISADEQLRRFEERQNTPYKRWKLTPEDWRNREKWGRYDVAVEEMLLRTGTPTAPWTVVEANFKWFARVKCFKTVVAAASKALDYKPVDPVSEGQPKKAGKKKGKVA
jgi:polyphosphate kinase 2 (PPK2 family)